MRRGRSRASRHPGRSGGDPHLGTERPSSSRCASRGTLRDTSPRTGLGPTGPSVTTPPVAEMVRRPPRPDNTRGGSFGAPASPRPPSPARRPRPAAGGDAWIGGQGVAYGDPPRHEPRWDSVPVSHAVALPPPPRARRDCGGQRATATYRAPTPAAAARIAGPSSPSQTHSVAPRRSAAATASAPSVETW